MTSTSERETLCIAENEAIMFASRCFISAGVDAPHARMMATALVQGDKRGHFSHGLNRLPVYVGNIDANTCRKSGKPEIIKESLATALVDGKHLLGAVVGTFCMELAIEKARATGMGWVTAKASNHFGIAGYYSMLAMKSGMIGFCMANGTPTVVPTRAATQFIATNPWTCAAPASADDSFVLDMATSCVAMGKVEIACRQGTQIPLGWGVDSRGKPTTDPHEVFPCGGACPLGGTEETGGYKGSGLGCMVEILTGVLANATLGPRVRPWLSNERPADLGQTYFALDPTRFAENFEERLSDFLGEWRSLPPVDPEKPVLVAGDPERDNEREVDERGGILYNSKIVATLDTLARNLGVEPMKRSNIV